MRAGGLLADNFRSLDGRHNSTPAVKATLFTPRDLFSAFAGEKAFITPDDFQNVNLHFLMKFVYLGMGRPCSSFCNQAKLEPSS